MVINLILLQFYFLIAHEVNGSLSVRYLTRNNIIYTCDGQLPHQLPDDTPAPTETKIIGHYS